MCEAIGRPQGERLIEEMIWTYGNDRTSRAAQRLSDPSSSGRNCGTKFDRHGSHYVTNGTQGTHVFPNGRIVVQTRLSAPPTVHGESYVWPNSMDKDGNEEGIEPETSHKICPRVKGR